MAMENPTVCRNPMTGELFLETRLRGYDVLNNPYLNKGMAFSQQERIELELEGLLPATVKTLDQQCDRMYEELNSKHTLLEKNVFLTSLHDHNETLFFYLLRSHLPELLPLIYTPVVGEEIRHYSHIYPRPRGIYLSYENRDRMAEILDHRAFRQIDLICVTDGQRILGLGDQGVGGIGITLGKLILYTACAGIHPATTLPIGLDVGTDNEALLQDPHYIGWRHPRLTGEDYDGFIEQFVTTVQRKFPYCVLHWEDFGKLNAIRLLDHYCDRLCTFNDDLQGTGAVALVTLLVACQKTGIPLKEQKIVFFGAGTAAIGIARQLVIALQNMGLSATEAYSRLYLINRSGLLQDKSVLLSFQVPFAQPSERLQSWNVANRQRITLSEVVSHVQPTVLIGVSSQAGAFSREIIEEMALHVERPIILPLSNPNSQAEAQPQDLIHWTNGRVMVATGSPFDPVAYQGRLISISQCNNAYIFPGLGLGAIATGASRISEGMLYAAATALSRITSVGKDFDNSVDKGLLPPLENALAMSEQIAIAVGQEAYRSELATTGKVENLGALIDTKRWQPSYYPLRPI